MPRRAVGFHGSCSFKFLGTSTIFFIASHWQYAKAHIYPNTTRIFLYCSNNYWFVCFLLIKTSLTDNRSYCHINFPNLNQLYTGIFFNIPFGHFYAFLVKVFVPVLRPLETPDFKTYRELGKKKTHTYMWSTDL